MARNPYYDLPWRFRSRILEMLLASSTPEEIRRDPGIAAALESKQRSLSDEQIHAIRKSREYILYKEKASRDADSRSAEKIAAAVINNSSALYDITDSARYELAKMIRELLPGTGELTDISEKIKAVRSLALSLSSIGTAALMQKINQSAAEILELKQALLRKEEELRLWQARASENAAGQVIENLNRQVGL
ncbi:MAG: hypothetical protein IJ992_03945 [Lentisphaeria bacterium]|nr:hypothetical protein [Lentisphaeria bacterium]MBR2435540.1 hypothetical protein [Lentisphaeria bacterium]